MSSITLSHASCGIGIGIFYALIEEKAAIRVMLDEEHEPLEQESGNHNSYTLGRIGKHNVNRSRFFCSLMLLCYALEVT